MGNCCGRDNPQIPSSSSLENEFTENTIQQQEEEVHLLDKDEKSDSLDSANQEILNQILAVLGEKTPESSPEDIVRIFDDALNLLSMEDMQIKSKVINRIFKEERRKARKVGKKEMGSFLKMCVWTLEKEHREELEEMIRYLPPAVLGDEEAKGTSRVLINICDDVRHAIDEDKISDPDKKRLLKIVMPNFENYISSIPNSRDLFSHILKKSLDNNERLRSVMSQVILSRIIPPSLQDRQVLVDYFFK
jgi:hypothetical protein